MHELAFAFEQREIFGICRAIVEPAHHIDIVDHSTTQDVRLDQSHETVVEHFAGAVQADRERIDATVFANQPAVGEAGRERFQHRSILGIACVAQDQCVAECVRQRADSDLQRAAVAHQCAGIQANRELGVRYRLPRQRKQLRRRAGQVDHRIEPVRVDRSGAADPRQRRVDFRDQQRTRQSGCDHRVDRIETQVGVAAQRQPCAVRLARDFLHQHVHTAIGECACHVRVVEARIAALRRARMQQRTRLHVELLDLDIGR